MDPEAQQAEQPGITPPQDEWLQRVGQFAPVAEGHLRSAIQRSLDVERVSVPQGMRKPPALVTISAANAPGADNHKYQVQVDATAAVRELLAGDGVDRLAAIEPTGLAKAVLQTFQGQRRVMVRGAHLGAEAGGEGRHAEITAGVQATKDGPHVPFDVRVADLFMAVVFDGDVVVGVVVATPKELALRRLFFGASARINAMYYSDRQRYPDCLFHEFYLPVTTGADGSLSLTAVGHRALLRDLVDGTHFTRLPPAPIPL
jgi:hypothetical protein